MSSVLAVLATVCLGAATISALVFAHECGHVLAARACGVRVAELFLGLPCGVSLRHTSKRSGTTFGISPLLLGGYSSICGTEPIESPYAAAVLAVVHRHGGITAAKLAAELGIPREEALAAGMELEGWGSVTAVYEGRTPGHGAGIGQLPDGFAAAPRDARGNTRLDGRAFDAARSTAPGEPWNPPADGRAFLAQERRRVYAGAGFWRRACMLLAGIAVNIALGLALLTVGYAVLGTASEQNVIGTVEEGSPAEAAGLEEGDAILALDGVSTSTWSEVRAAQQALDPGQSVLVTYERAGQTASATVVLDENGYLGIQSCYDHPGLAGCAAAAASFLADTAAGFVGLFTPSSSGSAPGGASSIVEVFQTLQVAARRGAHFYLEVVAALSFSIAVFNLLPVPPLDGGKLLIELVQVALGHELTERGRGAATLAGTLVLLALCAYLLLIR